MSPLPSFNSPFESKTSTVSSGNKDTTKPAGSGKTADEIEDLLNSEDDVTGDKDNKDDKKPVEKDDEEDDDLESNVDKDDDKENEDDDDKDDEDEDKDDDDKDDIDLKEDAEEDEEEKEKLDLKSSEEKDVTAPPKVKDIEKKFPEFFKEFPFMKRMMFRDKAYTEMFGSYDEAKEVYNKVERLGEFEGQLLKGDIRDVLSSVKSADGKAFDRIVDSLLKQIAEVDKEAYDDITQNFAKQIIMGIASEAKRKDNKELDKLAKDLHDWLFDGAAWTDVKVRVKAEKSEEENKVENERKAYIEERFQDARKTLTTKVDNVLKATISEYIDPRGQMSNYEKKNAISETLTRLHARVAEDAAFRKNLDRLWRASISEKFSENSLNGIKKSYLGKSRGLLSSVIKEVRGEVLRDNRSKGKTKKEEETPESKSDSRKNVNAGRPHQQTKKANERQKGESVEDFLMRD